ncbi:hypothetical protein [Pseudomonas retamae]|uniref:Uncharacterized protein n=1 Tax=Pseudomonas retamae TaxID=702110 RepID=A0ABW7DI78_9PSED
MEQRNVLQSSKHKKNASGQFTLKIDGREQTYDQYQYIIKVPTGGLISAAKHIGPGDYDIDTIYLSYPNGAIVDQKQTWKYPNDVVKLPEKWALHYGGARYVAVTGTMTATFKTLHEHIKGDFNFDGVEENGTRTINVSGDFELIVNP